MRLQIGSLDRSGRVLDCRDADLDPARVARAVGDPADDRVRCPRPGPLHEHVGLIGADEPLARRRLLAAVAVSRGHRPPVLDDLAAARRRLDDHTSNSVDRQTARERVASTDDDSTALRERVARLRGEVRARREAGLDASDAHRRLRDTARTLSEAATERSAAVQRLADARERATAGVDERRRRLRLEDRVANLERDARATLANSARPDVSAALARLADVSIDDAPSALVRLAAARVGIVAAPIVLTAGPFGASDAAEWLGTQVIRL